MKRGTITRGMKIASRGSVNGVVAHPLLLRWNRMKWEPKKGNENQSMNTLEARISQL